MVWAVASLLVLLQCSPDAFALLAWDRLSITDGQYWRLFSSALAHYDWQHLLINLALALPPALWLADKQPHALWQLYLLSTVSLGIYLLFCRPDMDVFAGMSGYVMALWTYVLLQYRQHHDIIAIILLLLMLKVVAEAAGFQAGWHDQHSYLVLWEAHAAGMSAACLLFCRT